MDVITLSLAYGKAKKYVESVALNGVPVNYPQVDPVSRTWKIFNPVSNSYIDTGIVAEGKDGQDAPIPSIGVNGNWFVGTADTGVKATGKDGREIEIITDAGYIKWRLAGDPSWINLVALAALKGADGREINLRMSGTVLQWQFEGGSGWQDIYDFSNVSIPAKIGEYVAGTEYSADDAFIDPATKYAYHVVADYTAVSIAADLTAGKIYRFGGQDVDLTGYAKSTDVTAALGAEATARDEAIAAERALLESADTTLQGNIEAEAKAREDADALAVQKAGDTMTGALHILDAVNDDEPVAKGQFDTGIENARAYTDQKIAAAVSGDVIGFFEYGRAAASTAFPATASEGAAAFDFEANTEYTFSSGAWNAAAAPVAVQDKAEIIVAEMLDGTDRSGNPMAGEKAAALYLEAGAAWQFLIDRGQAPDGETIRRRTSDGALETFGVIADNPGSDALPAAGEKQGAFGTLQTLRDNVKQAYDIIKNLPGYQANPLLTMGPPNYALKETTNLIPSYGVPWIADRDGYLTCSGRVASGMVSNIVINKYTCWSASPSTNYDWVVMVTVSKGDSVVLNGQLGMVSAYYTPPIINPPVFLESQPMVDYALIEQPTGRKWLDGKEIYQKTVSIPITTRLGENIWWTSTTTYASIGIAPSKVLKYEVYKDGNNTQIYFNISMANGYIQLLPLNYYVPQNSLLYITLWYTK